MARDIMDDPPEAVTFVGAWLNILLGIGVIVTPFLTEVTGAALWNNVVTGVLVAGFASFTAWSGARGRPRAAVGSAGANVVLGVWVIASPFLLGVGGVYLWTNATLGVFILFVAAYNAWTAGTATGGVVRRAGV